ncbi:MAG: hypothetical protein IK090_06750 [Clostridia bacterium]|nr:hypothetical protein [Clostridia bacterium]
MKKTKRLLSLLLVPVLLLLASCGGTVDATTAFDGTYAITFSVSGNETTVRVPAGETPVYTGETSWETSEHYYKITGWDKEIAPATENATYTATVGEYGLTVYEIRFSLKTASDLIRVSVHEGETPTPPDGYDAPFYTDDKIGNFSGWDKEIVPPTAENMNGKSFVVYTARYTYAPRYYDITFVVEDTEYKVQTAGKTLPECPVTPEKDGMLFVGWDKEIAPATSDAVYTARFMSTDCPTTFTVASWNIGHYANGNANSTRIADSDYETKSQEYRDYIEGLDADILCVNEYSRLFTPSNPAETALFAERPPIYFAGEQRHFSCNAVFSNLPLRNITVHNFACNQGVKLLYSSTNKAEYYYYITAELVVGTETVHFVFTHLAFDEDRSPDTVCQAQIAELIDLYRDVDHVVMMGDWNAYHKFYFDPFADAGYSLGNYGEILTCTGSATGGLEWAVDDIIVKGLTMTGFRAVNTSLSDHIAVVATVSLVTP